MDDRQRDVGTEAVPGDERQSVAGNLFDGGEKVVALGRAVAVGSLGPAASEVERHAAPGIDEPAAQGARPCSDACRIGVGMADDGRAGLSAGVRMSASSRVPSPLSKVVVATSTSVIGVNRTDVDGGSRGDSVAGSGRPCPGSVASVATSGSRNEGAPGPGDDDKLPVKMLNDRILVEIGEAEGERRSTGASSSGHGAGREATHLGDRGRGAGPNVRNMEPADRVLFNPEDRYEVEVRGADYIILRERDVHAVAAERLDEGSTGLYL